MKASNNKSLVLQQRSQTISITQRSWNNRPVLLYHFIKLLIYLKLMEIENKLGLSQWGKKIFFVWYPNFPPTKLSYEARNHSCKKRWQKQNKIIFIDSICFSYLTYNWLIHKPELNVLWIKQSRILQYR